MRLILASLLVIVTFFSACSTISKNQGAHVLKLLPPPIDLDSSQSPEEAEESLKPFLASDQDPSLKWWANYQLARVWTKSNPDQACKYFLLSSHQHGSPLAPLAQLRALETCSSTAAPNLSTAETYESIKEPWVQTFAAAAAHRRAIATKSLADELYFGSLLAKTAKLQTDKVKLLTRSVEIAKELQLSDKVLELEGQLYEAAPRFIPEPGGDDYFRVALDYRTARSFAKAREYYSKVLSSPNRTDLERFRALEGIRASYKLEERTAEYLRSTADVAKFAEERFKNKNSRREWIGKYHEARLTLARTVWTKESAAKAKKIILQTQKTLANEYPLTESNWLLARIEEEAGRYDKAVEILEKVDVAQLAPDSDLKQKVLWYKAWNMRRSPRWQEAMKDMELLINESTNPFVQSRTRYWLGRTYKEHELPIEATTQFEWLSNNDPLGYYGILATRELGRQFDALPNTNLEDKSQYLENDAFENKNDAIYFEWLVASGEDEVAQSFLDFLYAAYLSRGEFDTNSLIDFLRMYPRVNGFKSLFARVNELSLELRNKILKEHPSLLFPMPFKSDVIKAGEAFAVEPEFIYSIMRQESSFDPHARSGADAFGLLQLIPKAARHAQTKAPKVKYEQPEDLYIPQVNIPLGTAFIADTMKRYKGQLILTAAAYNASEEAIKGWLKTRYRNDPAEFIEDIPYEETRTYVKLVLRNYLFYKRLNLRDASMPFPERCLSDIQGATP